MIQLKIKRKRLILAEKDRVGTDSNSHYENYLQTLCLYFHSNEDLYQFIGA
jgi:hypothetical protein